MKKKMKRGLSLLLSLVLILSTILAIDTGIVNAAATTKGGENITYTLSNGVLTLTGTGEMYDFRATNVLTNKKPPWQDKNDTITKVVVNEGITTIGDYSFYNCVNLTTVELPSTITSIHGSGTESLSYGAFQGCTSLTKINFPEGLKQIQYCAFKGCTKLANIIFPSTLEEIQFAAFYQCESLASVEFPDSLTKLGMNAFHSCLKLQSVKFGAGMTTTCTSALSNIINPGVFRESGVKYVDFGPTVTEISPYTFYGCKMTSIEIPEQIKTIGTRAFGDTYYLSKATVYNANTQFNGIVGEDPFNAGDRQVPLTMYGHTGSTTQQYASEKGYNFVSIDDCEHTETFEKITKHATCTEAGSSDTICNNCQQVVRTNVIEALGHKYSTVESNDQTKVDGHIYSVEECERCFDTRDVITHVRTGEASPRYVWVEGYYEYTNTATCTRPGLERFKCTVDGCGTSVTVGSTTTFVPTQETIDGVRANHSVENWDITQKATCTEDGSKTGKCTICGQTVTEIIKATGHSYPETPKESFSNVEEDGHTYNVFVCETCSHEEAFPTHVEWLEGKFTPNVITPAHCVVSGLERDTCDICGETRNVVLPANGEHDWYVTNETEPTCTAVGKIFYACHNCNMTKSDNVEALGHDFQLLETEGAHKDPTCIKNGYDTYGCSRCSAQSQEKIDALGHTPVEGTLVINKQVTCTEDGMESATCDVCGENYQQVVKALGHDYYDVIKPIPNQKGHSRVTPTCSRCRSVDSSSTVHDEWAEGWYVTDELVEAGCLVQGRTRYECTYCGATKTEVTATPLGHHYIATGAITNNSNISYRCEFCNTVTLQNPHNIFAMWDIQFINATPTNRTAVDNTSLLDANGDGCVNAKDYALLKNLMKVAPVPEAPVEPETPGKAPTMEQFIYFHLDDVIKAGITYTDEEGNEVTIPGVKNMTAEEAEEAGLLFNKTAYPITDWPVALSSEEVPALNDPAVQEDPYGALNSPLRYYYCATSNGTVTRLLKSGSAQIAVAQQAIALPYYQAYIIKYGLTTDDDEKEEEQKDLSPIYLSSDYQTLEIAVDNNEP